MRESAIVRVVADKLCPPLILLGLYLCVYGHLTPGGGFQGGVVIGSAVALLIIAHGGFFAERRLSAELLHRGESLAVLFLLALGIVGMVEGEVFLTNIFPVGQKSSVSCALMMVAMNLAIGVKVGAGVSIILYVFARYGRNG